MTVTPVRNVRKYRHLPHMVYELYDSKGNPIYVGCTRDIVQRLGSHRRQPWWRDVAEIHTATYANYDEATAVEAQRIAELQPPWNFTFTEHASEAARERWVARKAKAAQS